jgi:hypothetical protein
MMWRSGCLGGRPPCGVAGRSRSGCSTAHSASVSDEEYVRVVGLRAAGVAARGYNLMGLLVWCRGFGRPCQYQGPPCHVTFAPNQLLNLINPNQFSRTHQGLASQ